jgi:hypothetical protein
MASSNAIEEFRVIYLKEYGVELPYEEALKQANSLLRLYKAVLPVVSSKLPQDQESNLRNSA